MDENTKHIVASNLAIAFYVGQAYHQPYNDPAKKEAVGLLDAREVLMAYQQFLRLMAEDQTAPSGT
jgi:hypothetical protein